MMLLLLACAPKEEAAPALSVTPLSLDLGSVAEGDSASGEVEIRNSGGGSLEILSASLVDGDARAWSVERDGFGALGPGAVSILTVSFSPEEEGESPAEIQVRSSDTENPTVYVELTATGAPSTADDDADGYSAATGDCDDGNADVHPGATEECDGRDDDCDGTTPADETDADGDGVRLCEDDCDDGDSAVYPGAPEICDEKDSDCDGSSTDHDDIDGDGYAICDGDCDDADGDASPGGVEVCDGADNDCSGSADDLDADGDGATLCGSVPDCDDDDPDAFPIFVDPAAESGGDGTEAAPYDSLEAGLDGLDLTCRTIVLAAGLYDSSVTWTSGPLTLVGTSVADVVFTPAEGDRSFTVTGGSLTLEYLTLTGAAPTDGDGGAIAVTGADLVLVGVVASGNSSVSDGGAVSVSSGTLTLDGCTLSDNLAGDDGGAVAVVSSTIEDRGSTWSGNTASQGGGLLAVSSGVTLDTSIFIDGTATTDGGGIALDGATPLAIEGVVLSGNTAVRGGGLALNDVDAEGYVRNLLVVGNVADEGGGVAYTGSVAAGILANTTLVGNTSTGDGAALLIDVTDAAGLWVWANVFAWNDGDDGLHAVGGASVDWNLGYATDSGTDFDIDVEGPENLVDDPLFRDFSDNGDPSDDDLTPSAGSPARNSGPTDGAGPAGYTTWADSDGTRNDRGYTGGPGGQ